MSETGSDQPLAGGEANRKSNQENVHSATDPQKCREIEQKYGWTLKAVRPTRDPILKVDCVKHQAFTTWAIAFPVPRKPVLNLSLTAYRQMWVLWLSR